MKLYILYASDEERSLVMGVFDSREAAQEQKDYVEENNPDSEFELSISEIEMNKCYYYPVM